MQTYKGGMQKVISNGEEKKISRETLMEILNDLDCEFITLGDFKRILNGHSETKFVYFNKDEWDTIFNENGIKKIDVSKKLGYSQQSSLTKTLRMGRTSIGNVKKIEDEFGIRLPYKWEP